MPNENGGLYLQFENQSLCVKLRAVDPEKGERRRARGRVLAAAREVAPRFPGLVVEESKGRAGETMTLLRLSGVKLTPDPRDERLQAGLREAYAFLQAIAAILP